MSQIYDVIVIGGGPGGYTAALYAARANLSTLVLEKLTPGGQMGTTDVIDNYPGFPEGIGGFELAMQMKQGAERFGAKTELSEVISVELKGPVKQVRTQWGAPTRPARWCWPAGPIPGSWACPAGRELGGAGVSYCATCDGMFYRNKTVAVVGAATPPWRTCCTSPGCARRCTSSTAGTSCGPPRSIWTPAKGGECGVRLGQPGPGAAVRGNRNRRAGEEQKDRPAAGAPL